VADAAEEVLARPELADYDQIPVRDCSRVVGVLERLSGKRKPLDESILVSADEALANFIHTVRHQSYRLVVDGTAITGIVTWSDLLKTPVLLLAYSLLAQLELLMNRAIYEKYGRSDGWMELLDKEERKFIIGRAKKLKMQNLALPYIELADFAHKAKVVQGGLPTNGNFEHDIEELRKLRNDVAHVHQVVRSDADLHHFVDRLEIATTWFAALSHSLGEAKAKL
jgi:hypothetical protein